VSFDCKGNSSGQRTCPEAKTPLQSLRAMLFFLFTWELFHRPRSQSPICNTIFRPTTLSAHAAHAWLYGAHLSGGGGIARLDFGRERASDGVALRSWELVSAD